MKHIILQLTLICLPAMAFAESQIDRLASISQAMNTSMFEMMIREAEAEGADPEPLRATIPDGTWDENLRDAGQCMLDRMTDLSSASAVENMLDEMEAALPRLAEMDMESMGEELDFLPDGITDDMSIEINSECGMVDLMMERMEESGFMAAMMNAMK